MYNIFYNVFYTVAYVFVEKEQAEPVARICCAIFPLIIFLAVISSMFS